MVRIPFPKVPEVTELVVNKLLKGVVVVDEQASYPKAKKRIPNIIPFDKSFGKLVGYYLAEGHVSIINNRPNSGNVVWTFSSEETEYINDVVECVRYVFGVEAYLNCVDNTTQIVVGSKIIADIFKSICGSGSKTKQIHPIFMNAPNNCIMSVLNGYLRGDGCFDDASFSTTSLAMALGILNISYKLGLSPNLFSSITRPSQIKGRIIKSGSEIYTVRYRGSDRTVYSSIVGVDNSDRRAVNFKHHDRCEHGIVVSVKSNDEIDYNGMVYNFSVNNTETYIANGIAVHNCAYRMPDYLSNQNFNEREMLSYEKIIETLDCVVEMGVKAVQYTGGGEPLVHPRIKDIFRETFKRGLEVSLVTNGMALDEELCDILGDAAWVRVSVDCATPDVYSFIRNVPSKMYDHTIENIKMLVKHRRKSIIGVGFVVEKENYHQIYDAAKMFKEIGVDNFRISAAFTPMGFKYFETFLDEAKKQAKAAESFTDEKYTVFNLFNDRIVDTFEGTQNYHNCPVKDLLSYIGADYNVYTCCTLAYNDKGLIGSIKDQSFKDLWESSEKQLMFDNHDPAVRCQHPCMYKNKNEFINYCIKTDARHVNYI